MSLILSLREPQRAKQTQMDVNIYSLSQLRREDNIFHNINHSRLTLAKVPAFRSRASPTSFHRIVPHEVVFGIAVL
jgi:hypothetical protein